MDYILEQLRLNSNGSIGTVLFDPKTYEKTKNKNKKIKKKKAIKGTYRI